MQDSYNSGPFKSCMSSSSGSYFHQSCHVTKACVSLNWHQRRQTFFVEKVEGMRAATSFCEVSIDEVRQVMTHSPIKVPLSTETVKGVGWRLESGASWSYAPPVKNFWLRHCTYLSTYLHKWHCVPSDIYYNRDIRSFAFCDFLSANSLFICLVNLFVFISLT